MAEIKLRDYQEEAIESLFDWWKEKPEDFPLLVLPTGAGKTIVFTTLIKRLLESYPQMRITVLAHRKELIEQTEDKMYTVWRQAPVGVMANSLNRFELSQITIGSRGTVASRVDSMGHTDLLIVDECHNISPNEKSQYQKIIGRLQQFNPNMQVLGVTATPYRTGSGFIYGEDELFAGVAYEVTIKQLIKEGYLCTVVSPAVKAGHIDTKGIKTQGGEFAQTELAKRAAEIGVINSAVDEWQRLALNRGRKATIVFCVSVLHAQMTSAAFASRGFKLPVVHGQMSSGDRTKVLEDYANGRVDGFVNVGIATEGFDAPRTDTVMIMRPTRSLGLFIQMVGRGLRLHDEKQDCLLLDFGGCLNRFGPIDIAQPVSRKKDDRTKTCPECNSICGIFKRKCDSCGFEFQPPPYKLCPECDEENSTAAVECVACKHVFVSSLTHSASKKSALSDGAEEVIKEYEVESITYSVKLSQKSGNPMLVIGYRVGILNVYYQYICIGFDGYAGDKALQDWQTLTTEGSPLPHTADEARRILQRYECLKPITHVTVKHGAIYNEVLSIRVSDEYTQKEASNG